MRKGCLWAIIGFIALVVLIVVIVVITVAVSSSDESGPPSPSAGSSDSNESTTAATPLPQLSAQQLLAEREANATRFDDTRKGTWVTVSGRIENIDRSVVYLEGDGFLQNVGLRDLPRDKQIPLNVGQDFSATCKVGNYFLGTIYMNSCQ